ncbi:hypothetical protein ACGFX4_29015 [Kitasatospora sp. NPDC048365]|uniref:hypothetical protein n=1 Tax=Kitasatospora sp. NPDC048365 TaxID=3364050 RepID=UPI0037168B91
MSTGTGGSGYRVEVDNLRAFATQVRGLLGEFQARADGSKVHGQSGVGRDAFGTFAEAQELYLRYAEMRDSLRHVLDVIYDAIDEAQQKADRTAANYEDQEYETSRAMKLSDDGWSVPSQSAVQHRSVPGQAVRSGSGTPQQPVSGTKSEAETTW